MNASSPTLPAPRTEHLRRCLATATTCAIAVLPCLALGFTAPAFAFAGVTGIAAILAWSGLAALESAEQTRATLTQERDRLFARGEAQALRAEAAEVRLRRMGERVRELYFEYDAEARRFVHLSPVFERMFGVEAGSAYADSERVFDCFDASRRELFTAALGEGTGAERLRLEFKTPEGLLRRVSLLAELDERDPRLVRGTLTLMRVGAGLSIAKGDGPDPVDEAATGADEQPLEQAA